MSVDEIFFTTEVIKSIRYLRDKNEEEYANSLQININNNAENNYLTQFFRYDI